MIVRKTLQELADALEPARDQLTFRDPEIWMVERGSYKVQGINSVYDVDCGRMARGNTFFVSCRCPAGQIPSKYCYHALKAFETHIAVMNEFKKKRKENNL